MLPSYFSLNFLKETFPKLDPLLNVPLAPTSFSAFNLPIVMHLISCLYMLNVCPFC